MSYISKPTVINAVPLKPLSYLIIINPMIVNIHVGKMFGICLKDYKK